jgi:hypothetical protein
MKHACHSAQHFYAKAGTRCLVTKLADLVGGMRVACTVDAALKGIMTQQPFVAHALCKLQLTLLLLQLLVLIPVAWH